MSYEDVVKLTYAYVILSLRFLVTYGSQNSECVSNYSIININVVTVIGITSIEYTAKLYLSAKSNPLQNSMTDTAADRFLIIIFQ